MAAADVNDIELEMDVGLAAADPARPAAKGGVAGVAFQQRVSQRVQEELAAKRRQQQQQIAE